MLITVLVNDVRSFFSDTDVQNKACQTLSALICDADARNEVIVMICHACSLVPHLSIMCQNVDRTNPMK